MIYNGKDYVDDETWKEILTPQVCVVGSGPAGITVAWYLAKKGMRVTIIEGSRDWRGQETSKSWPDKSRLYGGQSTGQFATNEPDFLIRPYEPPPRLPEGFSSGDTPSERERIFGGTSAHWGGQSRPLDAITFEGRKNFPAWPITRASLDDWYAEAASFCRIASAWSSSYWSWKVGAQAPSLEGFNTDVYQFIGGDINLATRDLDGNGTTIGSSSVNVILNATLLDINHSGGAITSLTTASMDDPDDPSGIPTKGKTFTIRADRYVLAMGAVANARQLLLAKIPNDNIGRYFMAHPLVAGYISPPAHGDPISISGAYLTQSEYDFMHGNNWRSENRTRIEGRFSPDLDNLCGGYGSCWFWAAPNPRDRRPGTSQFYFEQWPNPESRVCLDCDNPPDPIFEQPLTKIEWNLSDQYDQDTYNNALKTFQMAVAAKYSMIIVTGISWEKYKESAVVNGHHLGTTRMWKSADGGVVDGNLKSHDLNNLYVAGSSVWTTAGIPNPTFSIITFSIRLAAHIHGELVNQS